MRKIKNLMAIVVLVTAITSCKTNKYSFLSNYPVKTVPVIDSTNFSNHVEGKLLSKKEQELLKLPVIFEGQLEGENTKVGISYLPKISENYQSVVYYLYPNQSELLVMLVNYDEKFNIINSQMLAYDEIAESMLKTTSTIYKDSIVLTEYISENPSTIKFNILENGQITRE
ncbi:hypothetical protein [Tenacibaculum sp. IB213877]|uniref:hypothetical protein n=1 Tax=Tenacibaculum sp. IB213877 TaxID=3097351 RepID=UPI002A5A31E3|nr:hypothetical protein [Tenacibaculum sp. IB213877]MDY0780797.1 hypothetical protein [Tenacibaculum sp. IB213877]